MTAEEASEFWFRLAEPISDIPDLDAFETSLRAYGTGGWCGPRVFGYHLNRVDVERKRRTKEP